MSFWQELKRRNVVKVAAVYAIVAWLLIQAASILLPTFRAPEWVMPAFVALLIAGLPIALIFAWAFELTPDGLRKTDAIPLQDSITHECRLASRRRRSIRGRSRCRRQRSALELCRGNSSRRQPGRRELGLPACWRGAGWPEHCRPLGANDFECD